MKRLLSTTTAIAMAITPMAPVPVQAQTLAADGSVLGDDGTVLCTPTAEAPCDLEAITKEVKKAKKAAEEAAAAAAAQAEAEQKAAEEAAAAAAAQAEAEQKAAEEAAAAAAAQAEAEQKAAEEAAAAAAAQAEAEQKAAEEAAAAAAAQAEAEQKAAEEAAAATAAQAEAEQKAAEDAAAAAAAQAEEEQKAAEEASETPASTEGVGDLVAVPDDGEQPEAGEVVDPNANSDGQPNLEMIPAPADESQTATGDSTTVVPEPVAEPEVPVAEEIVDTEAVTVPPSEEEVQALTEIISSEDPATATPTAAAAAAATGTAAVAAEVSETVLTEEDTRASTEDFATTASGKKKDNKKKKDKDEGLSDFEKAGLLALGALAVGAMLSNRDQVVANTGDRVVVQRSDGNYVVYKDDDALLRQPGSTVKTETFKDGSTRTTVTRADGTQVVTIRDATGRVLKRTAYDTKGRETVLIDDLTPEEPVVVSTLPKPRAPTISTSNGDAELAAALAAIQARELGRTFSLRQVRDIKEVRALAATVDVDNITFDTGSAAITAAQAENLADLGSFLKQMLVKNPYEIFLIEGHTDAVGSAAANLALSDRRAESVAKALTEYFGVPPENLVVQGYGEADLRVQTDGDERLNRRVAVRIITPLLMAAR